MRNDYRDDEYEGRTQYGYYTIGNVEYEGDDDDSSRSRVYAEQVAENETFKACIGRGAKKYMRKLWYAHPGKILGFSIGMLIGIMMLIFGFFAVVFVLLCGAAGLFVGTNLDRSGNWWDNIRRSIPYNINRWR